MASLKANIQMDVQKIVNKILLNHPERNNRVGKQLLTAFVWDEIASLAKGSSEDAWKKMSVSGTYDEPDREEPQEKILAASPRFELRAKVTEPVKRFSGDALGTVLLNSKYKVALSDTAQFVDQAKVGKKGNLLLSIVEKGQ